MIELITKSDAAKILTVSEDTVERLIRAGLLPCYKIAPRVVRLDKMDVYTYLDSRKHRAGALGRQTRVKKPQEVRRGGVNNSGYYPGMEVV